MLRKTLLTLSASAMLGTAGIAPNAAMAFSPPPLPHLGGPPPGLRGTPPHPRPAVLPVTLASVLLMVSLVSVVLLVSMVVIAVFRAILMVSEVTLQLTAPAIEKAMATVTMDAGDVMASTPTATGMAIPMKAATTPTATADTGAFWFAP